MNNSLFLTDAQLKTEMERCEYCENKPCKQACPANCSPFDFIMAARAGETSDIRRAAAEIMMANPLGGVCGLVCPDKHCMAACTRIKFDQPINIPAVQATLIEKAKELDLMPQPEPADRNGKKVAVVGAGPAGLAAALMLAQKGYEAEIFEKETIAGGACNLIPQHRLPKKVIESDLAFTLQNKNIRLHTGNAVENPGELLQRGFSAVVVAAGLHDPIKPGVNGQDLALYANGYLRNPAALKGSVAVVGGGAIATDCAVTAKQLGADRIEMFVLEQFDEMPLTGKERQELLDNGIDISTRQKVTEILGENGTVTGIKTVKIRLTDASQPFSLRNLTDIDGSEVTRNDFDHVIYAIGNRSSLKPEKAEGVFHTGDGNNGPTTVVEASAAGKNTALDVHAWLSASEKPDYPKQVKSLEKVPGYNNIPVSLETRFFDRKIPSPFLLSAAPPSDGYMQMKKAYEAGWAGGVMKTAFDNVDIHIPGEYMHAYDDVTYGNCDNVSGHPLDRVCREVAQLVKEYPDRLTIASTGGPVTGNDEADRKQWQSNTKKLEEAGAMAIEYSLSCPQGGDGTEGDIVSQNAQLTAKIIGWIMEVGNPDVPKLFKLTAQVTSIKAIVLAIQEVLNRYPEKKAGITLANTFPTLAFRKGEKKEWEEGIIFGMSGRGVTPISNLTLATVGDMGVHISGNGGPMNYKEAANFLALGVKTVQFCTIVMKYGYGIIDDLKQGLAHLMQERGIQSVEELTGIANPTAVTGFMELTPEKKISDCNKDLCVQCGNCTRCPYLAISIGSDDYPTTDPERCIGCSICMQKCISGALFMRKRTEKEAQQLKED